MPQSLSVMLTPSVVTPWAHLFVSVKLALTEMDSVALVRKKHVKLDSLNNCCLTT